MNYKIILAALITAAPICLLSAKKPNYDKQTFAHVLFQYDNLYDLENIHAIIQELDHNGKDGILPQEGVGWLGILLLGAHEPSGSKTDQALYLEILEYCYQHGFSNFKDRNFTPEKVARAIAISNDTEAREQLNNNLLLLQDGRTATQEDIVKVYRDALASPSSDNARQEIRRIITLWKNNHYSFNMLHGLYKVLVDWTYLLSLVDQRDSGPGLKKEEQKLVDFLKEALPGPTQGWFNDFVNDSQDEICNESCCTTSNYSPSEYDQELITAICNGNKAGVQTALSKGANPEATYSGVCLCLENTGFRCMCQGISALSVATYYYDIEIIEFLLEAGAVPVVGLPVSAIDDSYVFPVDIEELLRKYEKPEPIQSYPFMIFSALFFASGDPTELPNIIEDHICDEACGITTCCPKLCCK